MPATAMTTFLDRKIDVCFGHADQNGDGVLEQADTLATAARIIAYLGESFSSPKALALLVAIETFWGNISEAMDANHDGKVTRLEWREGMRQGFADDSTKFDEGLRPLAEAVFAICDRDNDGKVGPAEFAGFQKAFGTSPENSRIAFEKLDRDGNGFLEVEELLKAWREYYTSTDPEALGNWLYGDIFGDIQDGPRIRL